MKKICFTCKIEKPLSEFNKDKNKADGYSYKCRECTVEYHRQYREKLNFKSNPDKRYKCNACGKFKFPTEFFKAKDRKNGVREICKDCQKEYALKNRERINELNRKRYQNKKQAYNEINKDAIEKKRKEVLKKRKERKKYWGVEAKRRWREKYPEKNKQLQNKLLKKHSEELSDLYIIELIRNSSKLKYSEIKNHKELIETKRLEIKIRRIINNHLSTNP